MIWVLVLLTFLILYSATIIYAISYPHTYKKVLPKYKTKQLAYNDSVPHQEYIDLSRYDPCFRYHPYRDDEHWTYPYSIIGSHCYILYLG